MHFLDTGPGRIILFHNLLLDKADFPQNYQSFLWKTNKQNIADDADEKILNKTNQSKSYSYSRERQIVE